jgi:hypothetical protein
MLRPVRYVIPTFRDIASLSDIRVGLAVQDGGQ